AGQFEVAACRTTFQLAADSIFLTYPGFAYRCRHSSAVPADVCFSITLKADDEDEDATDLLQSFAAVVRRHPVLTTSNRLAYLKRVLEDASSNPLRTECRAHELLTAVGNLDAATNRKLHVYRKHQLSWYAERVDACRVRIEQNY